MLPRQNHDSERDTQIIPELCLPDVKRHLKDESINFTLERRTKTFSESTSRAGKTKDRTPFKIISAMPCESNSKAYEV